MNKVKIVGFDPIFADAFARLNYAWIEKFFAVEKHDREILDDPQTWIIGRGGEVFMALADGEPAGTVAMVPSSANMIELTKMAVDPRYQGIGIADRLMTACIEFAKERDFLTIFLESHTSLGPAINLYRKYGFVETPLDPSSAYARVDIRMELAIGESSM